MCMRWGEGCHTIRAAPAPSRGLFALTAGVPDQVRDSVFGGGGDSPRPSFRTSKAMPNADPESRHLPRQRHVFHQTIVCNGFGARCARADVWIPDPHAAPLRLSGMTRGGSRRADYLSRHPRLDRGSNAVPRASAMIIAPAARSSSAGLFASSHPPGLHRIRPRSCRGGPV